jgi:ubiquinone/menaquinone biosynthesis C-methylase UbiE
LDSSEKSISAKTGALYGDLWHRYSDEEFTHSIGLIYERMVINQFDFDLIRGKRCLDLGCGGGRASALMLELGAKEVTAVDVSETGLQNAAERIGKRPNIIFTQASCLDLPFENEYFDFIWCSGVLHHTESTETGFTELLRVLKKQKWFFLLLYGAGGARWDAVMKLRSTAQRAGYDLVNTAAIRAGLTPAKQRHFLDDLFVPIINFYTDEQIRSMLQTHGVQNVHSWSLGKPKDETSQSALIEDLETLGAIFFALHGLVHDTELRIAVGEGRDYISSLIGEICALEKRLSRGEIEPSEFERFSYGFGHHRLHGRKP